MFRVLLCHRRCLLHAARGTRARAHTDKKRVVPSFAREGRKRILAPHKRGRACLKRAAASEEKSTSLHVPEKIKQRCHTIVRNLKIVVGCCLTACVEIVCMYDLGYERGGGFIQDVVRTYLARCRPPSPPLEPLPPPPTPPRRQRPQREKWP